MPSYKIEITEAGDAGVDLSWVDKMESVDGAVLITKCISPDFSDAALKFKDKVIIHATITGYGGIFKAKCPKTNADRIRSMSDEELRELLREIYDAGIDDASAYEWGTRQNSFIWDEKWLQQPTEEDDI